MKPTTSTWLTRSTGTLLLVWLLVLLQGCTAMSRPRAEPNDPAYAPVRAQAMMQRDPESGAIFQSSRNYNFYGDTVALNIGDVLTVTLNESTRASKNAETKINKDSDISMPEPIFWVKVILASQRPSKVKETSKVKPKQIRATVWRA